MQGGNVTIDDDEIINGSGLARAIFDRISARHADQLAKIDAAYDSSIAAAADLSPEARNAVVASLNDNKKAARLNLLRYWADTANDIGPPIVAYIQAEASVSLVNVKATVSTSTSTGRTPNPNNPDTAIQGPASAVELPVTGDGGATALGIN